MDRLNHTLVNARVDLPSAVHHAEQGRSMSNLRTISAAACEVFGLIGFVCCGAAVIVAANLLALQIR